MGREGKVAVILGNDAILPHRGRVGEDAHLEGSRSGVKRPPDVGVGSKGAAKVSGHPDPSGLADCEPCPRRPVERDELRSAKVTTVKQAARRKPRAIIGAAEAGAGEDDLVAQDKRSDRVHPASIVARAQEHAGDIAPCHVPSMDVKLASQRV